MSPFELRTVTGIFTSATRTLNLACTSGGACCTACPGFGAMGPSGACARNPLAPRSKAHKAKRTSANPRLICLIRSLRSRKAQLPQCTHFDAPAPEDDAASLHDSYNDCLHLSER